MREAAPTASEAVQRLAGDLIVTTLSALGKHVSERPRRDAEIESYADAVADMFSAYLERLEGR
jgi:hypothetical protein